MQSRLLASLLIVNLISLFVLMKLLPTPEATVLPKWEYTIESVADLEFEAGMRKLGEEGWEIVFARRASGSDDGV
ncbi:hypothetical protein IV102_17605 [bacterium]|nr:hypothetical protein [bacterium]